MCNTKAAELQLKYLIVLKSEPMVVFVQRLEKKNAARKSRTIHQEDNCKILRESSSDRSSVIRRPGGSRLACLGRPGD